MDSIKPVHEVNQALKYLLADMGNDADERKALLAGMDSLKPAQDVNQALRKVLAVMESNPGIAPSEADGGARKKRRVSVTANRCDELPLLDSTPWKPGDELPTKEC